MNSSYHSDSEFSDEPHGAASTSADGSKPSLTLMNLLCSDNNEQEMILSPRETPSLVSFNQTTKIHSVDKNCLAESLCLKKTNTQIVNDRAGALQASKLSTSQSEAVIRMIPISELQAKKMKSGISMHSRSTLITDFSDAVSKQNMVVPIKFASNLKIGSSRRNRNKMNLREPGLVNLSDILDSYAFFKNKQTTQCGQNITNTRVSSENSDPAPTASVSGLSHTI